MQASPFPSSVLRAPSAAATCTCEHWVHCDCHCHGRACDPASHDCNAEYLADEGGLTRWGCPSCTRGPDAPHLLGCELIGWNVPVGSGRPPLA